LVELVAYCDEYDCHNAALNIVRREHGFLFSVARETVTQHYAQLREQVAPGTPHVDRDKMEKLAQKYGLFDDEKETA
jgi:hypothetical protein